MIYCKELNKSFDDKSELIKELVENKQLIIDAKKSAIKYSDGITTSASTSNEAAKYDIEPSNKIYPVINTTNYMDSHGDVHAFDIWNKSVSEQDGKLYYVTDHELEVSNVIAFPKNVKPMLVEFTWKELGFDYNGKTNALVYEITLTGNEPAQFKRALIEGNIENSVRMQYVTIALCVNDSEYEHEKDNWDKYISLVANRERAEEVGYFWYVKEAKIVKEGSAVLFGSNDATPILRSIDKQEPAVVTPKSNNGVNNKKSNYYYTLHNV